MGICAITFVIAGLMISSVATIPARLPAEQNSTLIREIDVPVASMSLEMSDLVTTEKTSGRAMASTIIYDTEFDDYHPTVAGDASERFLAAFEWTQDEVDYYPWFHYSLDGGTVWEEAGYFGDSLGSEYPDVDANQNGFYGTFGPPETNRGAQWLVIAEDLAAITGAIWDWSDDGFDDLESLCISCYTRADEPWNVGGMAGTGYNGYETNDWNGNVFIFYPRSETSGAISWLRNIEDYFRADIAIDEVTEMSYSVYDHTVDANLLVRKDDFGQWDADGYHVYVTSKDIGDSVTVLRNPSIEAHDDNVVIVAEAEGDITCFYSNNGLTSVSQSTVVDSAMSPEVMTTFDGEVFVCSYVKNSRVYRKMSDDGGATWKNEEQVEDSQTVSEYASHDLGKSLGGVYSVWADTRGGDIDIYFGQAYETTAPVLEIISIKGGLGVTATIKNTGDAEATNVFWTMIVKGGLLGRINKNKNGSEATLAIGGEIKAKSGIILGFGRLTEIKVTATCDEGSSDSKTTTGMQILFFTMVS